MVEDDSGAESDLGPTEVRADSRPPSSGRKSRFTPGTILADRYRIVAPLGRGGMGEVYRAEDLKLGQQVALKFLPRFLESDSAALGRLYEEVRLGRQVSHPNVCRLYDIGEWEESHFIAMEYIDGEDLASLIRRIGKLPHEKALDLARDICAGLAAAHGLDVIHRDLKPANVMIDGRGNARITDFGLAAVAEDLEERREIVGTPAYMAPEQLAGGAVTKKTDLYALGLVLYEMFTGNRLYDGKDVAEIASQQSATSSQSLSRGTGDVETPIQRIIVRCLEEDPANRPASIHSIIAALPGGDPLQAALDAGETPSPEMVAAAGESGELSPSVAWPLLIITLVLLASAGWFNTRESLLHQIPLPLTDDQLEFRAQEIAELIEPAAPAGDRHHFFSLTDDYFDWARENREGDPWEGLEAVHTSPVKFRYRQSPRELRPRTLRMSIGWLDPPFSTPGMVNMVLDQRGNLLYIATVPLEKSGKGREAEDDHDWTRLIELAGFDPATLEETTPEWRGPVAMTRRYAWTATFPTQPDIPLQIEAGTFEGRPVWFEVFPPWQQPLVPQVEERTVVDRVGRISRMILFGSTLFLAAFLARRNLLRGRSDRKNAFRLAFFGFAGMTILELFRSDMIASSLGGVVLIGIIIESAIGFGFVLWLYYLALEPYLRRRWPRTLISSTRLLSGRLTDPRVGRDLLIGVAAGLLMENWQAFLHLDSRLAPRFEPRWVDLNAAENIASALALLFSSAVQMIWFPLFVVVVLLLAHLVLRNRALAIGFTIVAFTLIGNAPPGADSLTRLGVIVASAILVFTIVRAGLLAGASLMFTVIIFEMAPLTADTSSWIFPYTILFLLPIAILAAIGFYLSLGSQPLFADAVLEE